MTHETFDLFFDDFFKALSAIGKTKGKEYSNGEDRLGNFKRIAAQIGRPAEEVCWTYLAKHLDSLAFLVGHPEARASEPFLSRAHDAALYIILLAAIRAERDGIRVPVG